MDSLTIKGSQAFLESGRLNAGSSLSSEVQSSGSGLKTDGSSSPGASFAETLKDAVQSVNELQKKSDKAMENLAAGRTDNVAEVMIAAEKADIALRLMMQVRNKIIDAYQEVMKMQV